MPYADIWNQVITLFTMIGFLHFILTRKTRVQKSKKVYKTKKVYMTTERMRRIQAKKAHRKKTPIANNYIEACWDEIQKI